MGTEVFPSPARRPRASQADGRQASGRVALGTHDGQRDVMALTAKQEAFAIACAKGENASEAYRAAYESRRMMPKTINEAACRLLANSKVAARIAELRERALKAARLEIGETLRQLTCVLRSDARRL